MREPPRSGLVGAWFPGAGGDADGVPGVDRHQQADQRADLVLAELGRDLVAWASKSRRTGICVTVSAVMDAALRI